MFPSTSLCSELTVYCYMHAHTESLEREDHWLSYSCERGDFAGPFEIDLRAPASFGVVKAKRGFRVRAVGGWGARCEGVLPKRFRGMNQSRRIHRDHELGWRAVRGGRVGERKRTAYAC